MPMMVFEDPSRRRWRTFLVSASLVLAALGVIAFLVTLSVSTDAVLPPVSVANSAKHLVETEHLHDAPAAQRRPPRPRSIPTYPQPLFAPSQLMSAFLVQDDPDSVRKLEEIGPYLDVVFPDYLTFDKGDGKIRTTRDYAVHQKVKASGAGIMPRVSNVDAKGVWQGDAVSTLLNDTKAQRRFIDALADALVACDAMGVNIDIESLNPEDEKLYVEFLAGLADTLHAHKLYLTVDVPMNEDQYDYEAIGKFADAVVLMAYDEHFSTGKPGPIAGREWFADGLREYVQRVPPEKLIVAIGTYGYDWTVNPDGTPASGHVASAISYNDALRVAQEHRAKIRTSPDSINSFFEYKDKSGLAHQVHFLDAISAWNQFVFLHDQAALEFPNQHIGGVSIWRLGFEDPAVWDIFLEGTPDTFDAKSLAVLPAPDEAVFAGKGDLFRVSQPKSDGERSLTFEGKYIIDAEYTSFPRPYGVEKMGGEGDKQIVLTFDDGPDSRYTAPLLDLLKREKTQAAFFVVGRQVVQHPEMVRRALAEGHLVGNHTFEHPKLHTLSTEGVHNELNATQRALESLTQRQTVLFRSPYDINSSPNEAQQLRPLAEVAKMGYVCVGANVGAEDYSLKSTADSLVEQLMSQIVGHQGPFVVCLHDGGGDRSKTIEAVAKFIPQARNLGYSFVGLDQLASTTALALNPFTPPVEASAALGSRILQAVKTTGMGLVAGVFLVSTIIGVVRIASLGFVMFFDRKKQAARAAMPRYRGPVTVLVPAFNEGKVIKRTVTGILASDYPELRVLVIDDGSTDDTAAIVRHLAESNPRVSVLTKTNGGKARALNVGFEKAATDIVVVLDADTIVLPTTISNLVAPFADPVVTAVCGNVQVGNIRNLLTAMQDVEYVTCQNYDRRAFDALNCIGVVPGATGAWRRQAVLDAGGYSHHTLTEDADLTIQVLRQGGRIVYAPEAKSVTEVPETIKALYKQRFRWAFGTFQTLWKHKGAFFKGTLGWIGMPNHMIFQVGFPMLAPIGDAVLIYALVTGDWNAIASGYLTFIGMDIIGSSIAFKLDRRPLWGIWSVFIQRFCYRQFMYIVTFAAAFAVIRGRRHGWNKLDRLASVEVPGRLSTNTPTEAAAA